MRLPDGSSPAMPHRIWHVRFLAITSAAYSALGPSLYLMTWVDSCQGRRLHDAWVGLLAAGPLIFLVSTGVFAMRLAGRWYLTVAVHAAVAAVLGWAAGSLLLGGLEALGPACAVAPPCKTCFASSPVSLLPLLWLGIAALLLAPLVGWVARHVPE